jgi:hypothetical protein
LANSFDIIACESLLDQHNRVVSITELQSIDQQSL